MQRYEEKECVMWFTQILYSVQQQQSLVLKCWTSKDICGYDTNYYQFGFHVKLASYGQEDGLRNTHANWVGRYQSWHVPSTTSFQHNGIYRRETPGNAMRYVWELTKLPLGIPFKQIGKGALKFPSLFLPQSKWIMVRCTDRSSLARSVDYQAWSLMRWGGKPIMIVWVVKNLLPNRCIPKSVHTLQSGSIRVVVAWSTSSSRQYCCGNQMR